jgi:hypothetical protein
MRRATNLKKAEHSKFPQCPVAAAIASACSYAHHAKANDQIVRGLFSSGKHDGPSVLNLSFSIAELGAGAESALGLDHWM